MIEETWYFTVLAYLAFFFVVVITLKKLAIWKPGWEMRAELTASAAGLTMLLLLAILVT